MKKRAFTLVELLVVISIIGILISILMPALAGARASARQLEDSKRASGLHTAWLTYAASNNEEFPTPSHIDRLAHPTLGEQTGFGAPDWRLNTTMRIYSASIMSNLFTSKDIVSNSETNPMVTVREYLYDVYDPNDQADDIHWMDMNEELSVTGPGCNFSYAMSAPFGDRFDDEWGAGGSSGIAMLGTRGPEFGQHTDAMDEEGHFTYQMHGNKDSWSGNIVFNDGQVRYMKHWLDATVTFKDHNGFKEDNLFNYDSTSELGGSAAYGGDTFLCIVVDELGGSDVQNTPEFELEWDNKD